MRKPLGLMDMFIIDTGEFHWYTHVTQLKQNKHFFGGSAQPVSGSSDSYKSLKDPGRAICHYGPLQPYHGCSPCPSHPGLPCLPVQTQMPASSHVQFLLPQGSIFSLVSRILYLLFPLPGTPSHFQIHPDNPSVLGSPHNETPLGSCTYQSVL